MLDVDGLLDGDVAPHRQLDGALQLADHQEGVVVLEVDRHGVEGERLDAAVRAVRDGGVGLRRRLQLAVALHVAAGQRHPGGLGLDFVGQEHVVVAGVLDLKLDGNSCSFDCLL